MSVRDIALGRRSLGAGSLDALTDLATGAPTRAEPTQTDGRQHVGVNHGDPARPNVRTEVARPAVVIPPVDPDQPRAETPRRRITDHPATGAPASVLAPVVVGTRPAAATVAVAHAAPPRRDPVDDLEAYIERRLEDATFVFLPNRGRGYAVAKRAFDLVGALCLLVVALPVMLVLGVIIRIDSPGPALFRQTRVTRGGRTFRFYKFRTMHVDAKERFPELYAYQFTDSQFDDAFYKLADDPRNTRFGKWLRRTTLDELPNLINVLRGELSLVGPRPELPELVAHYRPEELACFFTKAGLTGLAQVAGRSLLTVRERLTLDVRYVAHQTLLLDLRILWRTVLVVVAGRGAF